MLDSFLLNKLTDVHNTDHDDENDTSVVKPQHDPHSTSIDTTRTQKARARKNSTREETTSRKMAGTSSYDRLEGGLGPQRGPGNRRNWKKYAIIAGLVIVVLWFAAPRSENYLWNKDKGMSSLCLIVTLLTF